MFNYSNIQTEGQKMTPKISFLFVTLFSITGLCEGGSVVGNGAGLVEHNFQYAYTTLASTVRSCYENKDCGMSDTENIILKNILSVVSVNASKTDRILFVSEKEKPGFFETGPNERHRIAKTGNSAETPIYVNVDALYDQSGKPLLDYPTIVSILAHELGHQAGELDHAFLDIIGAKLKRVLEVKMARHRTEVGNPSQVVEVMIMNFNSPLRTSEIVFSWEGSGSRKVTNELIENLRCTDPEAGFAGFELHNGHYFILEPQFQNGTALGFNLWAYAFCYSRSENMVRLEKNQMRFRLNQDLKVELIDVVKLP